VAGGIQQNVQRKDQRNQVGVHIRVVVRSSRDSVLRHVVEAVSETADAADQQTAVEFRAQA